MENIMFFMEYPLVSAIVFELFQDRKWRQHPVFFRSRHPSMGVSLSQFFHHQAVFAGAIRGPI